jgi:gliding motility-associated-like protein
MITNLSRNRNLFFAFLFTLALLFAGVGSANAQCGNVTSSVGFPPAGCAGQFVAGQYVEVSTASPANVLRWESSTDGGATWSTISGTAGVNPLTYTYLNTLSGANFYVFRLVYITGACGPGNGTSFTSGAYNINDPPAPGSFTPNQVSLCDGSTGTYSLTGATHLFQTPGDPITTTYNITATGVSNANAQLGSATFTRTSSTSGDLSVSPTATTTTNIGTVTYHVNATNGSCAPSDIGSITVFVYPGIVGGTLSSTSASLCSGSSATLSLPGFTGFVDANAPFPGTTYSLASVFAPASTTCGAVTDGIAGSFTTGSAPGTVTITPTNSSNQIVTITYTVTITNGPCAGTTRQVAVAVSPDIAPGGISTASPTPTICTGQTATVNITNLVCGTGYNSAFTSITISAPTFGGAGSANMAGGAAAGLTLSATSASFTVSPTITQCDLGTATYTISAQNGPCAPVVIGSIVITVYPAILAGATVGGTTTICNGGTSTSSVGGPSFTCANGYSAPGGLTQYTISVASSGANITTTGLPGTTTNATGTFTVDPTNTGCLAAASTVTYDINATNNTACTPFLVGSFTVTVVPSLNAGGVTVTAPALVPALTVCSGTGAAISVNNLICATGYDPAFTVVSVSAPVFSDPILSGGASGGVTNNPTTATFSVGALTIATGDPVNSCQSQTATYTITGQNAPCAPITLGTITITVIPTLITATINGSTTICTGSLTSNGILNNICANGFGASTLYTISVTASGANITTTGLPGSVTNGTGIFTVNPTNTSCTNALNTVTYQVTATNGSPCSAFSLGTFTIQVTPSPQVNATVLTVGSSATALCNGASAIFTVTNFCASATLSWERSINGGGFVATADVGSPISVALTSGACVPQTYQYRVTATWGCTIQATSPVVTVYPDISITGLTGNASVCSGAAINLSVSITCAQAGATYELLDGGVPVAAVTTTFPATFAASLAAFSVANFTCADVAKTYSIRVTNTAANGGCTYTSTAPINFGVTVHPAPSSGGAMAVAVTSPLSICTGDLATITTNRCAGVLATWEVSTDGGATYGAYVGMVDNGNATYTTAGLTTGGCVTTTYLFRGTFTQTAPLGSCSNVTVSSNTVSVLPAPTPTVVSITASSGTTVGSNTDMCTAVNSATFTSTAPACGSIVRWEYSLNGGTSWVSIANTTSTLTVTNVPQNTAYRAVVSNGALCSTTFSNVLTVTVNTINGGTATPSPAIICTGSSSVVTLTGQTGNIIDWESSPTVGFGAPTSLALTTTAITVSPVADTYYRAILVNGNCTTFSVPAFVQVSPATVAGTITGAPAVPSTQCSPAAGTLTLAGNTGTVQQWEYSTDGGATWNTIANTTTSQTYSSLTVSTSYRALVKSGACSSAYSNTVSVTVYPTPTASLATSSTTLCQGSSANLTPTLSNGVATVTTYQIIATGAGAGTTYASSTTAPGVISVTPPVGTTTYTLTVTTAPCTPVTSAVTIVVSATTVGGTIAAAATTSCSPASGTLTLSGNTGAVQQWEFSVDAGNTWTQITNTTLTQNYSGLTQTTQYRALVQSGVCSSTYSSVATVTVYPTPSPSITSTATAICQGTSVTLTSSATSVVAGVTTYQITSTGATVATVYASSTTAPSAQTLTPAVGTTNYILTVTTAPCSPVTSTVTVVTSPTTVPGTITGAPAVPSTQCSPASGTLTLGGNTGNVQQWEYSVDNGTTWVPITNTTTGQSYSGLTATTQYRALVKSGTCSALYSNVVTITVYPTPTASITSTSTAICQGSTVTLTSTVSNVVAGVTTYQITSTGATVATVYASSTTAPSAQTLTPAVGTTNYILTVTTAPCSPVTSTVTVVTSPTTVPGTITGAPAVPSTQCSPASGTLTLGGNTGTVQQWEYSVDNGTTWVPITNTTTGQSYSGLTATTQYRALVKSGTCSALYSNIVTITVYPTPTASITSTSTAICQGSTVTLTSTVSNVVAGVTTYQITSTGATVATVYASSTTAPSAQTLTPAVGTTNYILTVTTAPCAPVTSTVTVVTSPTTVGGTLAPAATSVCATGNAGTITLSGNTGSILQWEYSIDAGSTWTVITNTTTTQSYSNITITTWYRALVKSGSCSSAYSAIAIVTVYQLPSVGLTAATTPICNGSGTTITGTATNTVAGVTTYTIIAAPGGTLYASSITAPTFPFAVAPSVTTTYTYTVTTAPCSGVSASTTVTVIPVPTASVTSSSPICATSTVVLTLSSTNTTAGLTTYKITSDYPSAGSVVYATNTTAPNSPFTVSSTHVNPNGVTNFTYTIGSAPCSDVTSTVAVTVYPVPTVSLSPAATSVCNGSSTTITGSSTNTVAGVTSYTITAAPGGVLYAASTTAPTFPFTVTPSATTTYTYTITNSPCAPVSATTTVTVIPVPTASVTSSSPICASTTVVLTLSTTNTTAGLTTYKITSDYPSAGSVVYATNTSAPNSPFTVNSTYVNPNGVTNYTYTVISAPCGNVTSTVAVTVRPVPTANLTLAPNPICLGSTTTLTINAGNTVGGTTTYAVGTSAGGTNIIGTTTIGTSGTFTTTSTVTPPVGTTTYFLTVITSPCGSVSSSTSVTVNPTSVGGSLSAGAIVCPSSANSTTFTLSGQTGTVLKWQLSTDDGTSWSDITNTLTTYTATNVSVSTLYRAVVQSGVCASANSASSGVFVNTSPTANFSSTTVCFNTPPTVFTNTTSAGSTLTVAQQTIYNIVGTVTTSTTYAWNFGDPTSGSNTSALTNPTHAYTAAGTFTVTLTATTSTLVGATTVASCSNTVTKSATVNIVTAADYTTSPVCFGNASTVSITNFNNANTYSVLWGDATAAQAVAASTATRTYGNPGRYSVRLKVTNTYGCSDSITKNVTAWALPATTGVSISNTSPCLGTAVTFAPIGATGGTTFVIDPITGVATATVANAASITSYAWDFGDGATANTSTATHTYAVAGTYTVKLTITNSNGCSQTFTFSATPVTVQPLPVSNFSATTVCSGFTTSFTDASTIASGSITGWAWNFGDPSSAGNNTSSLQNPTHLFTAAGTYTVTLTVTTAATCTNTTSKQVTVNPLPLVNFNALPSNVVCAGSTITFNSASSIASGTIANYGWRVSDNTGNFNFSTALVSVNNALAQTFATAGTYNVRLIVTSASGCSDSATKSVTVNANPTAVINVNPGSNQICIYETFTFTSTGSIAGSGAISNYAWTFGDGSTSSAANPAIKSYANPGSYTVTLTITNSNGCTNFTSKTVTVNPKPVVNFSASNVCFGYTMNFTDASTTGASSTYLWNFGDPASGVSNTSPTQNTSHNFTTAGTYNVKLVVTNATGCKDSVSKLVTVWPRPVADFQADTVCAGNATNFNNLSTIASGSMNFYWSFGDALNTTSISTSPSFLYTPGVYSAKLIVTSGFGCIDSIRKTVVVKATPKPAFVFTNVCLHAGITLDTTGSNATPTTVVSVNYGDGSALTASLSHTYAMSGTYTVSMTMTDNGCSATLSKIVTIFDLPLASFSVSAYTICMNSIDTFSNTSSITSGSIIANTWDVINSSNIVVSSVTYASNQAFIYAFNTAGIFRVRLTATSDKGCSDTTSKAVTVNDLPTVVITSVNFKTQAFHACFRTAHEFSSVGSTAGSGTIASYLWDFGDGNSSVNPNPIYAYKAVGSYIVTLQITNTNGCSFSKSQLVVVDAIPDATITPSGFPVATCDGTPFTLSGPSGTGYSYIWTKGGVTISTNQTITVTPPASGWYYLAVTSGFGCANVDSAYLTVYPLPVITLNPKQITMSKGWNKQVTANVTGPNPTFSYLWTAQDAKGKISDPTIPNPVLTPPNDVNSYWYAVTVTDQKGCIDRDTVYFTLEDDYNLKPSNLMTPNNDGKNDKFAIQNIETYPDVEVTIFNRWGNVVYQTKNYAAAPWNGTYNNTGGDLPDGTYYYIIRTGHISATDGKEVIYKGYITILRGR